MKKLLLIWIFSGSLDGFSQVAPREYVLPEHDVIKAIKTKDGSYHFMIVPATFLHQIGEECNCWKCNTPFKRDTVPEWMHVSATRTKGFVIARKALSVRVNGYCVTHLDCDKKPFPVHYHVGWCQGKDELLTAFLNERRAKQ